MAASNDETQTELFLPQQGRVTRRTLMLIRWIAIAGQISLVLIVRFGMDIYLPLLPIAGAIGALMILNIVTLMMHKENLPLHEWEAAFYLGFDIFQYSVLLYLTGGLANPFSILLLAPLTVGATVLRRRSVAGLASFLILCVSLISLKHFSLPWPGHKLPANYEHGLLVALIFTSIFIAAYVWYVARGARRLTEALAATQMALSRAQRMSAVGALAAAAAHELGSPLSTIAVIVRELANRMPKRSKWADDIALLQSQSERCKEILAALSRDPFSQKPSPFDYMTLTSLIREIAEPYRLPEISLSVVVDPASQGREPALHRKPEIMHGLGNLLQNAFQFARKEVKVITGWKADEISVTIIDDGPGFPLSLLIRVGEPYLSTRAHGFGHMGLGIFIAQTLLEKTGGKLHFNNERGGGARISVVWRDRAAHAIV